MKQRRRMTLPAPGADARRLAQILFGTDDPTDDQCWAAVDHRGYLHAVGKLPADMADRFVVRYDGRRGCDMGGRSVLCICGVARCSRPGRKVC